MGWWQDFGVFAWCSPCHSDACGVQINPCASDRPLPYTSDRPIVPGSAAEEPRAPWTPRAATSNGTRSGYVLSPSASIAAQGPVNVPPLSLLIDSSSPGTVRQYPSSICSARDTTDFNITPNPRAALDASLLNDPNAKAAERVRLKQIVREFSHEGAAGRSCTVVWLAEGESCSIHHACRYQLQEELSKFVLNCQSTSDNGTCGCDEMVLGTWLMNTVIGAHRAEESALVQKHEHTLTKLISHEELARAAVLEFGAGSNALRIPLLIVEESADYRDKFVNGMRILRLYRGVAQQRLESARPLEDKLSWPSARSVHSAPEPSPVKSMVAVQMAKPGERLTSSPRGAGPSAPPRFSSGGHTPRE